MSRSLGGSGWRLSGDLSLGYHKGSFQHETFIEEQQNG